MPRRFIDATALLADLIDRHEGGAQNPIAYPDYASFASVVAADTFIRHIKTAEAAGAVSIAWGRGSKREQVAHVRLEDAQTLYRTLKRTPVGELAAESYTRLVDGLSLCPQLSLAAAAVRATWQRGKSWHGIFPSDFARLRNVFSLAQAIASGQHVGVDYRTFSRRVTQDSKALERSEAIVVRLLGQVVDLPPGARPRDALRTLGLERFSPPLLISGRVNLGEVDLSHVKRRYLGIAPSDAQVISFAQLPAYVLTIENFASFNRHITEADPQCLGTTIYVGGYPSLATQKALAGLASKLPASTPIFHWSDIDVDRAWIFRTIERAIGRTIRPHLMSPELAERLGTLPSAKLRCSPCNPESGAFALTEYLTRGDAKLLEQEELDPCVPDCTAMV